MELAAIAIIALAQPGPTDDEALHQWPQWRGPLCNGVAPTADPPLTWSEDRNIRWKLVLPGSGHSSPVVWGDRVLLTAAIPYGDRVESRPDTAPGAHDNELVSHAHEFLVMAVDRRSGRILWERPVCRVLPHEGGHQTGSLASNSPVTDGQHAWAFFGSRGLYCLDLDGTVVWQKDLGRMTTLHGHGEGASPALFGDTLVVNWDHETQSFLVAFDKTTGVERWRTPRDEPTSWSTPLIVEHAGRHQVVVSATNRVRGYDLATGAVIWECAGLSRNVVASPVTAGGVVFAGNSYDWKKMLAIRLDDATGDLTGSDRVIWTMDRFTPYVPSPLLYGDRLYFLRHYQGILSCVDTKTGGFLAGTPVRLEGIRDVFASPVGAAGRVYLTDRDGTTLVIEHSDELRILARNRLDEGFSASAALVGRELFLRGEEHLYCIAEIPED